MYICKSNSSFINPLIHINTTHVPPPPFLFTSFSNVRVYFFLPYLFWLALFKFISPAHYRISKLFKYNKTFTWMVNITLEIAINHWDNLSLGNGWRRWQPANAGGLTLTFSGIDMQFHSIITSECNFQTEGLILSDFESLKLIVTWLAAFSFEIDCTIT